MDALARVIESIIGSTLGSGLSGGTEMPRDPESVIGPAWQCGQETEAEFFRRLGADIVAFLPNAPGPSRDRLELEIAMTEMVRETLLEIAVPDMWEKFWREQVSEASGALTAAELRARIVEFLDIGGLFKAMALANAISDEEATQRHATDDEDEDGSQEAELIAGLTPVLMAGLTPVVFAQFAEELALAKRVADSSPLNAIRSSLADGIAVHKIVQMHYLSRRAGALIVQERSVFTNGSKRGTLAEVIRDGLSGAFPELSMLDFSVGTGLRTRLRPDIVDLWPPILSPLGRVGEVYEIKPRRRAVLAVLQVEGYCFYYNVSTVGFNAGNPINRAATVASGLTYRPPRIVPATQNKAAVVFTHPGLPGLLLYDLFKVKADRYGRLVSRFNYLTTPEAVAMTMVAVMVAAAVVGAVILTPNPADDLAAIGAFERLIQALGSSPALVPL